MGAGKSLNGRGKKSGEEKSRTKIGAPIFVLDFSSPDFFPRPFRLFPAPTNCPWVSEDAGQPDQSVVDRTCPEHWQTTKITIKSRIKYVVLLDAKEVGNSSNSLLDHA